MTNRIMFLIAFSLLLSASVNAIRILGIFPLPAKSHFSCNHAILKSLHAAGHQVTMIAPFPSADRVENFTYVDSRSNNFTLVGQSTVEEFFHMTESDFFHWVTTVDIQCCYDVMKLPAIQEALKSPKKLYDVMLMELALDFECYLPIAEKLRIPVIGTVTLSRQKEADTIIGLPNNPAVLPHEHTSFDPPMSIVERVENIFCHLVTDYYLWRMRNMIRIFYREHFAPDLLYRKRLSLVFYNNHHSLLPRINIPSVIDVGGIHLSPAKSLSKNLQTFIDESPSGVILFTLGSLIKGSSIPAKQRQALLAAFASIPQRVIWKYEEPLENLPANVMISKWLPQRDILEHRNVVAFMSHCGQSGIYEAIITRTPVITIPLFGDQRSNAAILHRHGVGVGLNFETITKERVLDALNRIINDTSYYQRMQELSRLFQDRPMTPEESIVYWTEYVVKYDGAPFLKALGTDMPFYEYFMLDILILVLLPTGLIIYFVQRVFQRLKGVLAPLLRQKRKYYVPSKKDR